MTVALLGTEILRGREIAEQVTPEDWLHMTVALLCHAVGQVRGACRGDTATEAVINLSGERREIPRGASDAWLTPFRVDRGKIFVHERAAVIPGIDPARVARAIELTRFPVPEDEDHRETGTEAGLLRAAAIAAGPDAAVPTCPGWTVHRLVGHTAGVLDRLTGVLRAADPSSPPPKPNPPEGDFDAVLGAYDERLATMLELLRSVDPSAPAWHFSPTAPKTAASLFRRVAHEVTVHRIDAQAAAGGAASDQDARVDPEVAADGVDEVLRWLIQRWTDQWATGELTGAVLYHAADAGRAWTVRLVAGQLPQTSLESVAEPDASVVGLADAVYRAAWGRPSGATVTGDPALVHATRAR